MIAHTSEYTPPGFFYLEAPRGNQAGRSALKINAERHFGQKQFLDPLTRPIYTLNLWAEDWEWIEFRIY